MYTNWWIANWTHHKGQVHGEDSSSLSHYCSLLDVYRFHQGTFLAKRAENFGMSDQTNNQKSKLTDIKWTTKRSMVLLTFPEELGELGEVLWSTVVDLITNFREYVVFAGDVWCTNWQFNIKISSPRTSQHMVFWKKEPLFPVNWYLEATIQ